MSPISHLSLLHTANYHHSPLTVNTTSGPSMILEINTYLHNPYIYSHMQQIHIHIHHVELDNLYKKGNGIYIYYFYFKKRGFTKIHVNNEFFLNLNLIILPPLEICFIFFLLVLFRGKIHIGIKLSFNKLYILKGEYITI